jgi:hypothetical protein
MDKWGRYIKRGKGVPKAGEREASIRAMREHLWKIRDDRREESTHVGDAIAFLELARWL